jgi:hypothetical protein
MLVPRVLSLICVGHLDVQMLYIVARLPIITGLALVATMLGESIHDHACVHSNLCISALHQ